MPIVQSVSDTSARGYGLLAKSAPTIPTSGLQLYLDAMDPVSAAGGSTWNDISGNARHFNINSSALRTGSNSFKYMDFNGSYGAAKYSPDYSALTGGAFTIVAFTKVKNSTAEWRTLIRGFTNDHQVIIESGAHRLGMYDNDAAGFLDSGYQVTTDNLAGSWNMMVWRMNTGSPYYNFSLNASDTVKGSITNGNASYTRAFGCIGAYHNGSTDVNNSSQYWGSINAFLVYNRHITPTEQATLHGIFNARPHSGN